MNFLCTPRFSWLAMLGFVFAVEVLRFGPFTAYLAASAVMVLLVVGFLDYLLRQYAALHEQRVAEQEAERQAAVLEQAERAPNILERLKTLSESVNDSAAEIDGLRIDLKLAQAEREKAIEEREDIRAVNNYNRMGWNAEKVESQDLREQLRKVERAAISAQACAVQDGAQ